LKKPAKRRNAMRRSMSLFTALVAILVVLAPLPALASEGMDGAGLSLLWALPFLAILLCIATGPLFYPHLWEHHYDKFALLLGALIVVPLYLTHAAGVATTTL